MSETKADVDPNMLNEAEGEGSTDDIATLIAEHRATIDELKELVADHIPADGTDGVYTKYDDIFFLRYILSFTTAAKAKDAVIANLQYRAQPETQEMFRKIVNKEWENEPMVKRMMKYSCAGPLPPDAQKMNGPTLVVRAGLSNNEGMFQNVTTQEHITMMFAFREIAFMEADAATRASGKLVKQHFIFDMTGMKLSEMMDRRMSSVHTEVSSKSAMYYPQLLAKMSMCNTPSWITWVISFLRGILPKRNMDKLEVFATMDNLWESEYGQANFNREQFPDFLGGTLPTDKTPGYLTGDLIVPPNADDNWNEVVVARRSMQEHTLEIPFKGVCVRYDVVVAGYGIEASLYLTGKDGERTVLMEAEKKKAEGGLHTGNVVCPHAGVLTLVLDNSYSVVRGKTVKWRLSLEDIQQISEEKNVAEGIAADMVDLTLTDSK